MRVGLFDGCEEFISEKMSVVGERIRTDKGSKLTQNQERLRIRTYAGSASGLTRNEHLNCHRIRTELESGSALTQGHD